MELLTSKGSLFKNTFINYCVKALEERRIEGEAQLFPTAALTASGVDGIFSAGIPGTPKAG